MKTDFIIVGQGLAGTSVAFSLIEKGADVLVFDEQKENNASLIAAGIYHPMVFKQLILSWEANESLRTADTYYRKLENLFKERFYFPQKMLRIMGTEFEAKRWEKLAETEEYENHIETPLKNVPNYLNAPFGVAFVKSAGYVDTLVYLNAAGLYLKNEGKLRAEKLLSDDIIFDNNEIKYHDISAKGIIFCQGFQASEKSEWQNAFSVTRGDDMLIEIPEADPVMMNGGLYVVHRGNQQFRIGSTYFRAPFDDTAEHGRIELEKRLRKILKADYRILDQKRAIRPNTLDRRPLVGPIQSQNGQYVFNGLGSKGVLLSPFLADHFTDYLLHNKALLKEILPSRYGI